MKAKPANQVPSDGSAAVDAFMAKLKHPLKAEIAALRPLILGVSPAITEEIKWNSPGFRTSESFATVHLRSLKTVQVILHLGAKVRKPTPELKIADPAGLLKWLGPDRCLATLGANFPFEANLAAFAKIVRAWIKYV